MWGIGTVLGPVIGGVFTDSAATWRWAFYINLVLAAVTVLALTVAAQKRSIPDPIFREDLHPSGYPQKLPHQSLADYTDLTFLSDDLILVSLNERSFANSVEPLDTDKPPSKLGAVLIWIPKS